MDYEVITERLFQTLITGDRNAARTIVSEVAEGGVPAEDLTHDIYWPTLETITKLYRADQLSTLAQHYATRLLRLLVDQAQAEYTQHDRRDAKILLFSGPTETDELAGQMASDLVEAAGYEVFFGGGGIANDEILAEVGEQRPDLLIMFSSAPGDAPNIRQIIDSVREVAAVPDLQIMVGGGVFNRAEGLAEEIGADLWARDPREMIEKLETQRHRRATPEQRTVGRTRIQRRSAAA